MKSKKEDPAAPMASDDQLASILEFMRRKDLPKPLKMSVDNFISKKPLQTKSNAEKLIKVLVKCDDNNGEPAKVDAPQASAERNELMNLDKEGMIDQAGFLIGQMFGTVAEEQEFLSTLVVKSELTTVNLIDNNKGQLCNLVLKLRTLAAGKEK